MLRLKEKIDMLSMHMKNGLPVIANYVPSQFSSQLEYVVSVSYAA